MDSWKYGNAACVAPLGSRLPSSGSNSAPRYNVSIEQAFSKYPTDAYEPNAGFARVDSPFGLQAPLRKECDQLPNREPSVAAELAALRIDTPSE